MVLEETGAVPGEALPVAALADHLRLGTAFQGDALQAGLLESQLRAALAVIEGRCGKVLLARGFRLVLTCWRGEGAQALPVAPVSAVTEVALVDATGAREVLAAGRFRLERDAHRPRLVAVSGVLPGIAAGGAVEIAFTAGFAAEWDGVPADLRQAVLLLAAQFYEARHDAGDRVEALSVGVLALIERWRTVRLLGGGAA